ncbi:Transcription factor-like protein DPB [Bienertia sinuspersici]
MASSSSMGSPSSRSEAGMATPTCDNVVLRLSHLMIYGDDFTLQICEKGESNERTTYNEARVDELLAKYANASNALRTNHQEQGYDEKNICRRVTVEGVEFICYH